MSIDLQGKLKNFIKTPNFDTYDKYFEYLKNGILEDPNKLIAQELCKEYGDSEFVQLYVLGDDVYDGKYKYCIVKSHIGTCSGCLDICVDVFDELKGEIQDNVLKGHLYNEKECAMDEYNKMVKDLGINKHGNFAGCSNS